MASLLSAAHAASRACRRVRGIKPGSNNNMKDRRTPPSPEKVVQLLREQASDTEDEEPTSSSSTYSGDSSCSFQNPSLPGSVDGSDSESEGDGIAVSFDESSSKLEPKPHNVVRHAPIAHDGFQIAKKLCEKARSRKALCAAFHAADECSDGYLTIDELAAVFRQLNMPEGDAACFFEKMGGDQRGLFWREAVAIIDPLFKPEAREK